MGLLERLFPNRVEPHARQYFKLLNGYEPRFTTWSGSIYESELVRAAIDARARHNSKLSFSFTGTARPKLTRALQRGPNDFQTWSQFLYRTSTILDMKNTAFVVPILDKYGETTGIYTICPNSWELLDVSGEPWLKFNLDNRDHLAIELHRVGILTKFQYKSDLFGESNKALTETMDLISIQRQGIKESAKNAATYRIMAKVSNFTKPEDLAKERKRFDAENFKQGGGGILLLPNTYSEIQQMRQQVYAVNPEQMKIINTSVYNYFGVNDDVLQNKAGGDSWNAFYEGAIEPFAIQLSDVLTKMIFTFTERGYGAAFYFTSNRLQYMTNRDKLDVSSQMLDRGIFSLNEVREIWNMPPIDGGDKHIIRGEYYELNDKVVDDKLDDDPDEPDDTQLRDAIVDKALERMGI